MIVGELQLLFVFIGKGHEHGPALAWPNPCPSDRGKARATPAHSIGHNGGAGTELSNVKSDVAIVSTQYRYWLLQCRTCIDCE